MTRLFILFGALALSAVAGAHHSPNVHFDRGDIVEIAGTLTEIEWRNPHTLLIVETTEEIPVRVRLLDEERSDLDRIYSLGLFPESRGRQGGAVPISGVGEFVVVPEFSVISHNDGVRDKLKDVLGAEAPADDAGDAGEEG